MNSKTLPWLMLPLLLNGCANTEIVTGPCLEPMSLWSAGPNVVIAPPSSVGTVNNAQVERLSQLIQTGAAGVGAGYRDAKVVRLTAGESAAAACRPEVIRYVWSECSRGNLLISTEPVTVLWPFVQGSGGEDLYVGFSISNWIVKSSFALDLDWTTPQGKIYRIEAGVPIDEVTFTPRRISAAKLESAVKGVGCTLYTSPNTASKLVGSGECDQSGNWIVIDRKTVDGNVWLEVMTATSTRGWLRAPSAAAVTELFPEFGLLNITVAYQNLIRQFDNRFATKEHLRDLTRSVEEFLKTPISDDNRSAQGTAHVVLGAARLLVGAIDGDKKLLAAASQEFAEAAASLPYAAEAVNLNLIAELLHCCMEAKDVRATGISAWTVTVRPDQLEAHALRLRAFLKRDPASNSLLRNLGVVLQMLRDSGRESLAGEPLEPELVKVRGVVEARAIASRRDMSCTEITAKAEAARVRELTKRID